MQHQNRFSSVFSTTKKLLTLFIMAAFLAVPVSSTFASGHDATHGAKKMEMKDKKMKDKKEKKMEKKGSKKDTAAPMQ